MKLSIQANGLEQIIQRLQTFTDGAAELIRQRMLDSVDENIVPLAKSLAPKKTGALAASIGVTEGEGISVNLVATKSYAPYLEYGTRPHFIYASNARALHWQSHGFDAFAKYVFNPGIQALKFTFLWPALQDGIEKVSADIAQLIVDSLIE